MRPAPAGDAWSSGERYESYMGRWSRRVAREVLPWLDAPAGARWLDAGCGTGAVSAEIAASAAPRWVLAMDPSAAFVAHARGHLSGVAAVAVAEAAALGLRDGSVDVTVSGLVLNFVPDPVAAASEMRRVTAAGGLVAGYVWDYPGEMWLLRHFWDAAAEVDPAASDRHEGRRFARWGATALVAVLGSAGLRDVRGREVVVARAFPDVDACWQPFLTAQGPVAAYLGSLPDPARRAIHAGFVRRLPTRPDGSVRLTARAWAAQGRVPSTDGAG